MQFEKRGCGLLRESFTSNPRPLFQTECKMMSRRCIIAVAVSAKNNCLLLALNLIFSKMFIFFSVYCVLDLASIPSG